TVIHSICSTNSKYLSTTTPGCKRKMHLVIENTGAGDNNIYEVRINVPDVFSESSIVESEIVVGNDLEVGSIVATSGTPVDGSCLEKVCKNAVNLQQLILQFNNTTNIFAPGQRLLVTIPVDYSLLNIPNPLPQWSIEASNTVLPAYPADFST